MPAVDVGDVIAARPRREMEVGSKRTLFRKEAVFRWHSPTLEEGFDQNAPTRHEWICP
jgi:hypothetical protein